MLGVVLLSTATPVSAVLGLGVGGLLDPVLGTVDETLGGGTGGGDGSLDLLTVTSPLDGTLVRTTVTVTGTARSWDGTPLVRVEVSSSPDDWSRALRAEGTTSWRISLDYRDHPAGPAPVWVRACTQRACSAPERVDLEVIRPADPPVAVLDASPRVVWPATAVRLDARHSYSPAGDAIVAYRFHLGDGRRTGWLDAPVHTVSYARPGTYEVVLEVQDRDGHVSTNSPGVTVHVVDRQAAATANVADLVPPPRMGAALAAGVLVLATVFGLVRWRRRRRRRAAGGRSGPSDGDGGP